MTISEQLIKQYGFTGIVKCVDDLDYDQFTVGLRVHEIHYLFYSELHKNFSIGVRHEHPKKSTNGELKNWTTIMLPKVINSFDDADTLIHAICDLKYVKLYQ